MNFNILLDGAAIRFLLNGLGVTLAVALLSIVFSVFFGIILGVVRYWDIKGISAAVGLVVDAIRNLPLLLIIFFTYFALPQMGIRFDIFWATVAAMSIFESAMISEIVRSGIQSLPKGQNEAGLALGFTKFQTMWYIILPQALRITVPSIVSQLIALIKDTSLATVIMLPELTHRAKIIYGQNVQNIFPMFVVLAALYFVVCYALSRFSKKLEVSGNTRRFLFKE